MSVNERKVKNSIKRIIKQFPQYKIVNNIDNADIMVIYDDFDSNIFRMLVLNNVNKEKLRNGEPEELKIFYLKHKNPRNTRQLVNSNIDRNHFVLNR